MARARRNPEPPGDSTPARLATAMAWLAAHGTATTLAGMTRYGIPAHDALGVSVADVRRLAKELGHDHELAAALWETPCYEARLLACFVESPKQVTPVEMEHWAARFDSWAVCDTACFHLFSRTPHAWDKLQEWHDRPEEFVKRGAFALQASLVLRDRKAPDARFIDSLRFIEAGAEDPRNFVKKAVNWALRSIGKRDRVLNAACIELARRLAQSPSAAPRWVGKDALRELTSAAVARRLG